MKKHMKLIAMLLIAVLGTIPLFACDNKEPGGTGSGGGNSNEIVTTYMLTINTVGVGTATGSGKYKAGTTVSGTATAGIGFKFDGWYMDGESISTYATDNFTMPEHDLTLTAQFSSIEIPATGVIVYYNDMVFNPDTHYFPISVGTKVQLSAQVLPANATNKNLVWTVWGSDSYLTVTQDGLITAIKSTMGLEFKVSVYPEGKSYLLKNIIVVVSDTTSGGGNNGGGITNYTVSISASGYGGSPSVLFWLQIRSGTTTYPSNTSSVSGTFASGSYVTVTAISQFLVGSVKYIFEGWYQGSTRLSTSASYSFTLNSNRTLTAKYRSA